MIIYYIRNPNELADKIVEIYEANPNANVYNPRNKENNVKIQIKLIMIKKLINNIKNL